MTSWSESGRKACYRRRCDAIEKRFPRKLVLNENTVAMTKSRLVPARIGTVGKEITLNGKLIESADGQTQVWTIPDEANQEDVRELFATLVVQMLADGNQKPQSDNLLP